jgi:hypothetical protein
VGVCGGGLCDRSGVCIYEHRCASMFPNKLCLEKKKIVCVCAHTHTHTHTHSAFSRRPIFFFIIRALVSVRAMSSARYPPPERDTPPPLTSGKTAGFSRRPANKQACDVTPLLGTFTT